MCKYISPSNAGWEHEAGHDRDIGHDHQAVPPLHEGGHHDPISLAVQCTLPNFMQGIICFGWLPLDLQ